MSPRGMIYFRLLLIACLSAELTWYFIDWIDDGRIVRLVYMILVAPFLGYYISFVARTYTAHQ